MKDIDKFLRERLNPSQYEAVSTFYGPVLVVAGAGTGKTRVIEYRVLNLVHNGIDPQNILLLTFTRKAARSMLDRAAIHKKECSRVAGGTFHSFGFSVLKRYAHLIGFKSSFSFLDETDSEDAIHRLAVKLGYVSKKRRFPQKQTLKYIISSSINREESIEETVLKEYPHFYEYYQEIEALREAYINYKLDHDLLDYDDLLVYLKLLLKNDSIRETLSERYKFIMVDEYQDTNKIQAEIVYLLGERHKNVMVVGDDAQSIYGFRGAYFKNMFNFVKVFPDAKIIKLEANYRSTQPILDLANSIIEKAKEKYTKVLKAQTQGGQRPILMSFKDPEDEAEWISDKVLELRTNGIDFHQIGILFRSAYLARPLEISLSKRNIPYVLYGGLKFSETAHIKDVISYLKILLNPKDELAWRRVLLLIEGIGTKTAEKLISHLTTSKDWTESVKEFLYGYRYSEQLRQLLKTLLAASAQGLNLSQKIEIILEYYQPILSQRYDDFNRRLGDLDSLRQIAFGYNSFEDLILDLVAIEPPEKAVAEIYTQPQDEKPLTLSTIHSAKGLEWEATFIIGLSEGNLPISYSHGCEDDLEEERRLLYVAITRAKRALFLCFHHEGYRGGIHTFNRLCRFLDDNDVLKKLDLMYFVSEQDLEVPFYEKEDLRKSLLEELK